MLSLSQRIESVSPNLFPSEDRFFSVSSSVILLRIFFSSVIHLGIVISKFDFEHNSVIYIFDQRSVIHLRIVISKFDFEHSSMIHLRGFGTLRLLRSEAFNCNNEGYQG
ncbi:unnamed protein product [Camellia sinensis]